MAHDVDWRYFLFMLNLAKKEITLSRYEEGYIMLRCFKVKYDVINGEVEMTCNKFLQWVFRVFFARFWNGDVYLKGGKTP